MADFILEKAFDTKISNNSIILILIEQVSCGNGYRAPSCSQCTFSENWCNGECEFDWDDNKCKEKGKYIFLKYRQSEMIIASETYKSY